ncbi:MAG: hypothetical protein JXR11_06690 [Balneola sp.]
MNLILNGGDLDLLRLTSQDFNPQRLKAGKPHTAGPEGPAGLESYTKI